MAHLNLGDGRSSEGCPNTGQKSPRSPSCKPLREHPPVASPHCPDVCALRGVESGVIAGNLSRQDGSSAAS